MQNQGNIICPNCGGQNTADNNFFLYCGNSLTNLNQQQIQQTQQYNQYDQQQTQQYNQYNQQQTQQYNQYDQQQAQQKNQYNQQEAVPQKEKKVQKLGFLGWFGIISLGYTSLGNIFSLIFSGALAVLYFTTPNSKTSTKNPIKILRVPLVPILITAATVFITKYNVKVTINNEVNT